MPGKTSSKQSREDSDGVHLDLPKLVSQTAETTSSSSNDDHSRGNPPDSSRCQKRHPLRKNLNLLACHLCGDSTRTEAFLADRATNNVLQSWRQSSQKQYDAHIREWFVFFTKWHADPIRPTTSIAVDFLTSLYDERMELMSYSSINSVRCALPAILESPASAYSTFGEHPDIKRFMRGIFQSRPPLPRYCKLGMSICYSSTLAPWNSHELSLKDLTLKLVLSVALTTAQKGQFAITRHSGHGTRGDCLYVYA